MSFGEDMGQIINGIDVDRLKQLLKEAEKNKDLIASISKYSARVRRLGSGFNFKAYIRDHSFAVSEPQDVGGVDAGPRAIEYVLGALGACYATGFVLNATKRGVRIRNLEIALEGEIDNILVFLGLSDQGHPGYRRIVAKAYIDAEADEKTIKEIWEETVRTSPVGNTLARQVEIIPVTKVVKG
jgi:Predicted redox protein, regulator of disulfide bond formation